MTGRKATRKEAPRRKVNRQREQQVAQPTQQTLTTSMDDSQASSPPNNIKREQPPPAQVVKKIIKAENDEARTLKTVFKSNPDSQMKDFIKKASKPGVQAKQTIAIKTPAESHTQAVAQELLETDDDVADNLTRLFKASKSYKNV